MDDENNIEVVSDETTHISVICLIKTPDMCALESELHKRFADRRVNGEWFELCETDVLYIKGLVS